MKLEGKKTTEKKRIRERIYIVSFKYMKPYKETMGTHCVQGTRRNGIILNSFYVSNFKNL